ncbi:MAG: DnaJ domain-containing protein [Rhizobiales bacterium]|nr:DnaJ domain-containing protein [Hyphomicrobiales bacterium]
MRRTAGVGVMGVAAFIGMRGAFQIAVPLFLLGLGLFGVPTGGFAWNRKSPGQRSRVSTSMLSMELDHDSGSMDGEILAGTFARRKLSELSAAELAQFHRECSRAPDQSGALLEAWLDRARPGWRDAWHPGSAGAARAETAMSREEAYAVLGLKPGAGRDEIRSAHRRLMKEFHPDRGGSDYLAAKINRAKDVLLQD